MVKEVFSALMMNEEEGKRAVSEMEKRFLSLDYSPSKNGFFFSFFFSFSFVLTLFPFVFSLPQKLFKLLSHLPDE